MSTRLLILTAAQLDEGYIAELGGLGFACSYASSLPDAVRGVLAAQPAAVLVIGLGSESPQACGVVRALGAVPLVVAESGLSPDRAAQCLDSGADAVVTLPLPARELGERLRAVLRRAEELEEATASRRLTIGDIVIDLDARLVLRRGAPVNLSPTEYELLAALAERPGHVVTNRDLLTRVWGAEYADDVHYIRLYMGYLRTKLEEDPRRPALLLNQWGVGYRLAVQDSTAASGEGAST